MSQLASLPSLSQEETIAQWLEAGQGDTRHTRPEDYKEAVLCWSKWVQLAKISTTLFVLFYIYMTGVSTILFTMPKILNKVPAQCDCFLPDTVHYACTDVTVL